MAIGDIGAIIDSLEFEETQCDDADIIRVYGNVFAAVYTGPDSDGWIKTVTIANNGIITEPFIDICEFDAGLGKKPHIIHIKGTVYGIVYGDIWNDGTIKTYSILANGSIEEPALGTYEFATGDGEWCKIIRVTDLMVAVIFIAGNTNLYLRTIEITVGGGINTPYKDSLTIAEGGVTQGFIVNVSGNVFAIAYKDTENDCWIKTVTINDNGQIDDTVIDSYEFETSICMYPHIESIGSNIFAVFFTGGGYGAVVKTIEIAANGQITEPFLDSGIIDDTTGDTPGVTHVSGNVYAVVIKGVDADGWLKTLSLQGEETAISRHELIMGVG